MTSYLLLNIQFSFGENYYDSEPNSILFTLLITLFGAFFGAWIGFKFYIKQEKELREKKLKTEEKYFVATLIEALESVKQQSEKYKIVLNTQIEDLYHYSTLKRLCFKELQYLSKLNSSNLYEIFLKNGKIESFTFFDLFLSINYIQDILDSVKKSDIDNQRQYFNFVKHIEQNLSDIKTILYSRGYILKNKEIKKSKDELYFINSLIEKIEDIKPNDFKRFKIELIPLILSNDSVEYLTQKICEKTINKAKNISYYINKIYNNNQKISENLKDYIKNLDDEIQTLESTTKLLSDK